MSCCRKGFSFLIDYCCAFLYAPLFKCCWRVLDVLLSLFFFFMWCKIGCWVQIQPFLWEVCCACVGSLQKHQLPLILQKQPWLRWTVDSKWVVGVNGRGCGCLSLCVSPATDWQFLQDVCCYLPCHSRDRLKTPAILNLISRRQRIDGLPWCLSLSSFFLDLQSRLAKRYLWKQSIPTDHGLSTFTTCTTLTFSDGANSLMYFGKTQSVHTLCSASFAQGATNLNQMDDPVVKTWLMQTPCATCEKWQLPTVSQANSSRIHAWYKLMITPHIIKLSEFVAGIYCQSPWSSYSCADIMQPEPGISFLLRLKWCCPEYLLRKHFSYLTEYQQ